MKKIKIPIILALISLITLYLETKSIFSIWKIINKYVQCKQNPSNSFPCSGIYDIYFIFFLIVIFITSLIVIGVKIYKSKK